MVAFSCCVYDGGEQEKVDMRAARERGWKGKFTKAGRVIRPGAIRINGKCPLTPLEVISLALMMRNLDFYSHYPAIGCYCFKILLSIQCLCFRLKKDFIALYAHFIIIYRYQIENLYICMYV